MTAPLRDVSELFWPAVSETLASLDLDSKDAAAGRLAKRYARVIDETPDGKAQAAILRWLGPELLKVLESLGATPAARAALSKGAPGKPDAQVNRLDQLRAARTKRA